MMGPKDDESFLHIVLHRLSSSSHLPGSGQDDSRGWTEMKKFVFLPILLLILTLGTSWAIDWNVQTLSNYDWWKDNSGSRGMQVHVPLRIEARHQDFSISALTGYAYTQINPHLGETRSLSHLLDTKVNLSYEMVDKLPLDLLIGLDFNLPTGKTDFKERDLSLIMDPDLISINRLGEGFNFGPTLSLAKQLGNWDGGIGAGYV